MARDVRISQEQPEPGDRLGEIGKRLAEAFEADPEVREGERLMVLASPVHHGERGSILLCGYESEAQAKDDLTIQLAALYEAAGQSIQINVVDA